MTMRTMRSNDDRGTVHWLAALGAPVVGVPLMILLLALATPSEGAPVTEPEVGPAVEQTEVHTIDSRVEAPVDRIEPLGSC